jgi:glycosyltransferase involved in cell wall biosynthesis
VAVIPASIRTVSESNERIPILYLAPWVDLGGSDKGTIDWFKHLDRTRWAPSLVTTQPSSNRWLHQVEPYAEELWTLPDLMPGSAFPAFILGFVESRGIEVVHIMNSRLGFDLMPDMTCLRHPPAIVVQHHAEEPDRSGYVRYVAARYGNLVDAFSVTSVQLANAMREYDVAGSRVHVIHSGVDAVQEFDPAAVTPFEDLPGDGPHVLWPGRVAEQKDPMLTLEVLRRLRDRGVALTLHIVGDGHLAPEVRERARELGLDNIEWHPPSQEMARWYHSCDLLLMTSVFEGVPYVIYEALAMGLPVVAPALPGNVEFMDADSGVLVDPRDDAEQYARAVAELLGDDERRRATGARSRERMLRDYSLREMSERHEQLYAGLLDARGAAAATAREQAIETPLIPTVPAPEPLRLERLPPPERTVAIVVPCYQHGRFLAECMASIRAQTLAPAQVIVVDDRSEDPETDAALRALDDDPHVRVLRLATNSGPSAARNRALREVTANYVLALDADDLLLPDALETMVAQLESAPADVGFVYPNPQHFGNRHDYVQSPAYNLHLLLANNYCPATSLFDRRIFDAGVGYDEDIVFGHEDWDLVLRLAARSVWGEVAAGPTFKYRRRGFSRVNAVEYGPESFHDDIERRHPVLYAPAARTAIKTRWAPALSILLLDAGDTRWTPDALAPLTRQSCPDFELVAARPLDVVGLQPTVTVPGAADGPAWLTFALRAARGRWALVAEPGASPAFGPRAFVEQLLRVFRENRKSPDSKALAGVVLQSVPEQRLPGFAQIAARGDAPPVAVAWDRTLDEANGAEVELGLTGSVIGDLALAVQVVGPVHWRSLPLPGATGAAGAAAAHRTLDAVQ